MAIMLAGIPVADEDVHALAGMLKDAGERDAAAVLNLALAQQRRVIALTIPDRDAILGVLDDPPDGLTELRGTPPRARVAAARRPDPARRRRRLTPPDSRLESPVRRKGALMMLLFHEPGKTATTRSGSRPPR
jgi:hypothetical protein